MREAPPYLHLKIPTATLRIHQPANRIAEAEIILTKQAMKITHRYTGATLFEAEAETMLQCLLAAIAAGADLFGANLFGANLFGANLSRADLFGANLFGANLSRANLFGANLSEANLSRANLSRANLSRANLFGANLSRANLFGANLSEANLSRANLFGANLFGARELAKARNLPRIPVVQNLDAKILQAVESGGGKLEMGSWHTCETTHCRAGWAIHLAGEAGYVMESLIGSQTAGALIYHASTGHIPNFFANNEDAMRDIRERAAAQTAANL